MNTETTNDRRDMRAMLAEIALATDMPVPDRIGFYPSGILGLDLPTIAEGQTWSRHLGGKTDTYLNVHDGRRYLDEGFITWHGWKVSLHASEPGPQAEPLAEETAARLAELTTA